MHFMYRYYRPMLLTLIYLFIFNYYYFRLKRKGACSITQNGKTVWQVNLARQYSLATICIPFCIIIVLYSSPGKHLSL